MIAIIVGIILLIISAILTIVSVVIVEDGPYTAGIVIFCVICLMLPLSLVSGKSIYKQNNTKMLAKKEQIEYLLENNASLYVIEQAQDYNREVDYGNNLWCRFTIEDRSEYKIDIDKYIKVLEDEQKK